MGDKLEKYYVYTTDEKRGVHEFDTKAEVEDYLKGLVDGMVLTEDSFSFLVVYGKEVHYKISVGVEDG